MLGLVIQIILHPTEDISGTYTTLDLFIDFGAALESTTAVDNIGGGLKEVNVPSDPILGQVDLLLHQMHHIEKVKSLFSDVYTELFQIWLTTVGDKLQS